MIKFASWPQFEAWLNARGLFHMELGLDRMSDAMARLELPDCLSFQVLGTNGKGSTCTFLNQLALASGKKVGLYTSPHFLSLRERVRVNGLLLPKEEWLDAANEIMAIYEGEPDLTWFEFVTLLALALFRRSRVEVAIYEAGLGGANDATTAIKCQAQCFTPIAMDHAAIIGPSLADIARDKAGAMRGAAFSAPQFPLARQILVKTASERGLPLKFVPPLPDNVRLGLRGPHQAGNAALALAAWQAFFAAPSGNPLAQVNFPGRLQHVAGNSSHPALMVDGAHNPHAMRTLARALGEGTLPGSIVYSSLADKNWRENMAILSGALPHALWHIVQLDNERAAAGEQMAAWAAKLGHGEARIHDTALSAMRALDNRPALVTGSLYLLAEFYQSFPEYLT